MTQLGYTKRGDETYRECVERYASTYGLQYECLEVFDNAVKAGQTEPDAAFEALYEWDVLDLIEDDE